MPSLLSFFLQDYFVDKDDALAWAEAHGVGTDGRTGEMSEGNDFNFAWKSPLSKRRRREAVFGSMDASAAKAAVAYAVAPDQEETPTTAKKAKKAAKAATPKSGDSAKGGKPRNNATPKSSKSKVTAIDLVTPTSVKKAKGSKAKATSAGAVDEDENVAALRALLKVIPAVFPEEDGSSYERFVPVFSRRQDLSLIPTNDRIKVALNLNGREVCVGLVQIGTDDNGKRLTYGGVFFRPDRKLNVKFELIVQIETK